MSGAWPPRRFPAAIPIIVAVLAATGAAFADPQDTRAVQVLGGDAHAARCIEALNLNDTSDRALEECTRAMRYPRLTRAGEQQMLINRGVIYLRRRDGAAALADFEEVVRRNDENPEGHLNRGAALVMLGRHGEAIAAITEALGLGVMEPHKAYYNRGAARESLGDLRGAFEDYSTALEIQPDWGPANAELARFARTRRDHLATVLSDPPQN
jgi:tetratricopeptide (TPR) repeat protein